MLQLHIVGVDLRSRALLLSDRTDGRGGRFWVRVDAGVLGELHRLQRAVDEAGEDPATPDGWDAAGGALDVPGSRSGRSRSSLSPREIQARLRQGRTVEEVASEAGVELAWIERFAAPVRAEQRAAVERAGSLRWVSPTGQPSGLPLAEAVRRNLVRLGLRVTAAELGEHWSAWHRGEEEWVIRLECDTPAGPVEAEWVVDFAERALSAGNLQAADLAFAEEVGAAPGAVTARPEPG